MGKIKQLFAKLSKITEASQDKAILGMVKDTEGELVALNKEQLFHSEDSEQEPLGEYASISYANLKGRATVDLKLTGDFYGGFFVTTQKFPVVFSSTDKKTENLEERYGENIFGVTAPNLKFYTKVILLGKVQSFFRALLHI